MNPAAVNTPEDFLLRRRIMTSPNAQEGQLRRPCRRRARETVWLRGPGARQCTNRRSGVALACSTGPSSPELRRDDGGLRSWHGVAELFHVAQDCVDLDYHHAL